MSERTGLTPNQNQVVFAFIIQPSIWLSISQICVRSSMTVSHTKEAVADLVKIGVVLEDKLPGGLLSYRLTNDAKILYPSLYPGRSTSRQDAIMVAYCLILMLITLFIGASVIITLAFGLFTIIFAYMYYRSEQAYLHALFYRIAMKTHK